jgi:hypothetical protein
MYSRSEASAVKKEFWTVFGKYLSPHLSSEGIKISWVNYKTGYKDLYFRMEATPQKAYIAIEMTQADSELQEYFFNYFTELKTIFHNYLGEEWNWELHVLDEKGRFVSRIIKELPNVNVFKKEDWPEIISFLKTRILLLDEFWNDVKDRFEELR